MLKHLVPPFMELTLIKYQMLNYKSKDFISLCVRANLNHWGGCDSVLLIKYIKYCTITTIGYTGQ